jgi:hypothetical protein
MRVIHLAALCLTVSTVFGGSAWALIDADHLLIGFSLATIAGLLLTAGIGAVARIMAEP